LKAATHHFSAKETVLKMDAVSTPIQAIADAGSDTSLSVSEQKPDLDGTGIELTALTRRLSAASDAADLDAGHQHGRLP